MTGSGLFPKIDGDILWAHDVNKTAVRLLSSITDTITGTSGTNYSPIGSHFIGPGSISNFLMVGALFKSVANDNLGELTYYRIQVGSVFHSGTDILPETAALNHTAEAGHGVGNKNQFFILPYTPTSDVVISGVTVYIDGKTNATNGVSCLRSYVIGA